MFLKFWNVCWQNNVKKYKAISIINLQIGWSEPHLKVHWWTQGYINIKRRIQLAFRGFIFEYKPQLEPTVISIRRSAYVFNSLKKKTPLNYIWYSLNLHISLYYNTSLAWYKFHEILFIVWNSAIDKKCKLWWREVITEQIFSLSIKKYELSF